MELSITPKERILIENFMGDGFSLTKDWNGLMPVVEKIESMGYFTVISNQNSDEIDNDHYCGVVSYQNNCHKRATGKTKIDAVYKMILKFIDWYETQKP